MCLSLGPQMTEILWTKKARKISLKYILNKKRLNWGSSSRSKVGLEPTFHKFESFVD